MSDQNKVALCAVTSEILRELDKRIMELVRLDLKKGRHPTQGLRIGSVGRDFFYFGENQSYSHGFTTF